MCQVTSGEDYTDERWCMTCVTPGLVSGDSEIQMCTVADLFSLGSGVYSFPTRAYFSSRSYPHSSDSAA